MNAALAAALAPTTAPFALLDLSLSASGNSTPLYMQRICARHSVDALHSTDFVVDALYAAGAVCRTIGCVCHTRTDGQACEACVTAKRPPPPKRAG